MEENTDSPCGSLPTCPIGYECSCSTPDTCECLAPMDRGGCHQNLICRSGEVCREVETSSNGQLFHICWLDENNLVRRSAQSSSEGLILSAGAASMNITPQGFETATPQGLDGVRMNFSPPISVDDPRWNDCGYDGLCPDDEGYESPDLGERDGRLQGAFIAGFSHGRPAQYCPEELIGCHRPECCISKLAHDDLKAQITVLRRGELTIALVALDVIGIFQSDIEQIRRELKAALTHRPELGSIDHLIVGASHNHEGPDTIGQYGAGSLIVLRSGRDPYWMSYLRAQVVKGLVESLDNLQPARAEYAIHDEGIFGLGFGDSRPPYIFDDNIPTLRLIASQSGETIATLLSVANHAEFLWAGNPYLSADYFHFTRKYIQEGLDAVLDESGNELKPMLPGWGGVTVMFAGAVGGLINPGSGTAVNYAGQGFDNKGFDMADAAGQQIAARLLGSYQNGLFREVSNRDTGPSIAPLKFATQHFFTTIENTNFLLAGFTLKVFKRDIYNASHIGGISFVPDLPKVISEVSVVSLGDFTFFTAPGEVFPELLTGGYPDRETTQNPVIGDIEGQRSDLVCDERGLPAGIMGSLGGDQPCIVRLNQDNPPTWSEAPLGPYLYDLVSPTPFFIGLGGDFLGYIIPEYDFENGATAGAHYEETNSSSMSLTSDWINALKSALVELREL